MKIKIEEKNGAAIIHLSGKIMGGPDATMFHGHMHELMDAGKRNIIVDLNKVAWMSSIGMGMLIAALTTVKNNNGQFKIACIPDNISTLLTLTQLITIFDTHDTIEEALQSFSGPDRGQ